MIGECDATVEDAAEATLRIYARLARVKNNYLDENEFAFLNTEEGSSRRSNRWEDKDSKKASDVLPELDRQKKGSIWRRRVWIIVVIFARSWRNCLTQARANSREQRKALTPEELADLLRSQRTPKSRDTDEEGEEQDSQTHQMVQNLLRELDKRDPRMQSVPAPSCAESTTTIPVR